MKEFAQSFKIMKTVRLFFFTGILFLMTSCSLGENPDPKFDEEYNDSWDDPYSIESSGQVPLPSPFSKTFQISGEDQGYQCTVTCTKPE